MPDLLNQVDAEITAASHAPAQKKTEELFIAGIGASAGGLEALERFVHREPLRRVHECVFGVLALESEPVDPRL